MVKSDKYRGLLFKLYLLNFIDYELLVLEKEFGVRFYIGKKCIVIGFMLIKKF